MHGENLKLRSEISRELCFCHQLWLFWWRLCNRSSEVCEWTVRQPYCIWARL